MTSTFVVDRSERGKLALTGAEAKDFLHGQVTNDILGLTPGHGCYAAFLTHKGKMLGDMRVFDLGDELLLDCERVALQELFNMIRRYKLGRDVELHKRTLELGAAVGHRARRARRSRGPARARQRAASRWAAPMPSRCAPTSASTCSSPPRTATPCARALAFPDGDEAAAEIVRVEHGRPRYGVDLDDTVIPQEAGLNERAVSFTKGCYVGQETVARLYYRGKPNRRLLGLRLSEPVEPGHRAQAGREGRRQARLGRRLARPRADRAGARAARGEPRGHGRSRRFDGTHSRRPLRAVKSVQNQQFRPKGAAHGRSRDRARQPHRRGA